jgi:hypothetical protein
LCETIEERGIELRDDCGRAGEGAPYGNGEVAGLTADTPSANAAWEAAPHDRALAPRDLCL